MSVEQVHQMSVPVPLFVSMYVCECVFVFFLLPTHQNPEYVSLYVSVPVLVRVSKCPWFVDFVLFSSAQAHVETLNRFVSVPVSICSYACVSHGVLVSFAEAYAQNMCGLCLFLRDWDDSWKETSQGCEML